MLAHQSLTTHNNFVSHYICAMFPQLMLHLSGNLEHNSEITENEEKKIRLYIKLLFFNCNKFAYDCF